MVMINGEYHIQLYVNNCEPEEVNPLISCKAMSLSPPEESRNDSDTDPQPRKCKLAALSPERFDNELCYVYVWDNSRRPGIYTPEAFREPTMLKRFPLLIQAKQGNGAPHLMRWIDQRVLAIAVEDAQNSICWWTSKWARPWAADRQPGRIDSLWSDAKALYSSSADGSILAWDVDAISKWCEKLRK